MICSQRTEQWGKKKAERTTTSESIKRWRGQKYNEHINVNLEYLYQHLRVHELPASKLQSTKSVTNFSSNLFTACASSRASLSSSSPPNPFFFRIEFVSRCFFYSIPSNYSQIPWKIAYTFSSECSTHDKLSTDDNYLLNNAGNYAKNQQNSARTNGWLKAEDDFIRHRIVLERFAIDVRQFSICNLLMLLFEMVWCQAKFYNFQHFFSLKYK